MDFPSAKRSIPTVLSRDPATAGKGSHSMRLSIFWRLALGSLAIIVVVAGVNIYALSQLRQLSALSTELVSYHYPAIETAKRLIASLYTQLRSEKKYLAVRDEAFLKDFDEEVEEFRKTLTFLVNRETSPKGQKLLQDIARLHDEYLALFREAATRQSGPPPQAVRPV